MSEDMKKPRGRTGALRSDHVATGSSHTVAHASGPREVRATPGWPPVAVPGRSGWWRHHINGQQVDLPTREAPERGPVER